MKFAKEVKLNKRILQELEQQFAKVYTDFIFKEIFEILEQKPQQLQNEVEVNEYDKYLKILRDALYKGDIYYKDGNIFPAEGQKFGLKISKAIKVICNGKFNRSKKAYKIDLRKIDTTLRADITVIEDRVKEDVNKIQAVLQQKQTQELPDFDTEEVQKAFDKYAKDLEDKTYDSLKIGLNQYSEENIELLRKQYIKSSEYFVKKFNKKRLPKIREKLSALTLEKNLSHKSLVKYIKEEFKLSDKRCKFIARQESMLAKSHFIQEKAVSKGFTSYMWETAHDEKVRDNPFGEDHKDLDGKIFRFDDPPVVNHKTNKKANPGQDYNCRCVAKIVVSWD